ncbi:trigger factor [Faecalibacterium sp. CAG:1138]|nr:trigger factor [Faecalibacterium sp. CAG:1138]
MNYTVEKLEKSRVKFVIKVDEKELDAAIDEAYAKNKHKYQVEGFRKGHVPKSVLERTYGKGVFYEDALDIILPKYYDEVLSKETELVPVGRPEADIMDFQDNGVTFSVTVTVKPEVKLGQYKGLEVKRDKVRITEAMIEAELKLAQDRQSRLVEVKDDRASRKGDFVTIDFTGSVDGVEFDGGHAEDYDLGLGTGTFIPGFEEQLEGLKVGEEKDVKVTFPKDYGSKELAGKEAVFACKVKAIKAKEMPEINDEFAKDVSEFDTLDEYKKDIKKQLKHEADQRADEKVENDLVELIAGGSEVEVPDEMVEEAIDERLKELQYQLMYQGMQLDKYLEMLGTTMEAVRKDFREQAEKTVKSRLVMEALISAEHLEPTKEEVDVKIKEFADGAKKTVEEYTKDMHERQLNYIVNNLATDKIFGFLKANNTIVK